MLVRLAVNRKYSTEDMSSRSPLALEARETSMT